MRGHVAKKGTRYYVVVDIGRDVETRSANRNGTPGIAPRKRPRVHSPTSLRTSTAAHTSSLRDSRSGAFSSVTGSRH
jgi:hypothetical protein